MGDVAGVARPFPCPGPPPPPPPEEGASSPPDQTSRSLTRAAPALFRFHIEFLHQPLVFFRVLSHLAGILFDRAAGGFLRLIVEDFSNLLVTQSRAHFSVGTGSHSRRRAGPH